MKKPNLKINILRMKSLLLAILIVNLMMTSLPKQSAKAQSLDVEKTVLTNSPNPSDYTSYSPLEQENLVAYIKQCRLDKKNLADTKEAYLGCQDKISGKLLWWQTPTGVLSISFGSVLLGFVLNGAVK